MAHTPGPWKATGWKNVVVNAPNGCTLCLHPPDRKNIPLEEVQANAQLIASAPRMLKALQEIVRNVEPWKTCDNAAGRLFEIATGAINEATVIE